MLFQKGAESFQHIESTVHSLLNLSLATVACDVGDWRRCAPKRTRPLHERGTQ